MTAPRQARGTIRLGLLACHERALRASRMVVPALFVQQCRRHAAEAVAGHLFLRVSHTAQRIEWVSSQALCSWVRFSLPVARESFSPSNLTYREIRYFSEIACVAGYQCAAHKHRGGGDNAVGDFESIVSSHEGG